MHSIIIRHMIALATVAMGLHSDHAIAQQPDSRASAYMWSPEMQKRLYALALYVDKNALGKIEVCATGARLDPVSTGFLEPISFPQGGEHPNEGAWTIRYRFDRCGESIIYNALFRANAQGPATVFHLPPGTTRTSPQLMRDLNPPIFMEASKINTDKECKLVAVINTVVTTEPTAMKVGEEMLQGIWEEQWTVRTCSGIFTKNFCFVPARTGGTTWLDSKCDPDKIGTARALIRR